MGTRNIKRYQQFKIRENMSKAHKRWATIKEFTPEEDSVPTEIKYKGKNLTSPKAIAESYAEFSDDKLEEIRKSVEFENFKAVKLFKRVIPRVENEVILEPVTVQEIRKIIKNLKNTNSRGNTEITNKIVKELKEYLSVALKHLTNTIYTTGKYPDILKIARVLPLKKKGKPSDDMNSFRPINNLCPLDKIVEETLRKRIDKHLTNNKVIPNNTHGARESHSTTTAIMSIEKIKKKYKNEITKRINKKRNKNNNKRKIENEQTKNRK